MKINFKILTISFFILFANLAKAQLKVFSNGNVGIGYNTPTTKLWIEGTARFSNWTDLIVDWSEYGPTIYPEQNNSGFIGRSGSWFNHLYVSTIDYNLMTKYSDRRFKENIVGLSNVLPRIKMLGIYTYNYNNQYYNYKGFTEQQKAQTQRSQYGFVADELVGIFPELVYKSDSSGYMSVDYISMIPILTQAIKELQFDIEKLDSVILAQQKEVDKLRNTISNPTLLSQENLIGEIQLFQNSPNPFSINTEIKFQLPQYVKTATLYIHDLQGIEIKAYQISDRGVSSITIAGSELKAGMYIYSLVTDGKIFDSKRMILSNK